MEFLSEREVKGTVEWLLKIVYKESMVSDIGRACLKKIGYKSRWCARCSDLCERFGLRALVDLLWLRNFRNEEMTLLEMEYDRNVWKKINVENKRVWQEMAEEWFRNKWQKTGKFKSEESSSANIHFFMFDPHQLLFVIHLFMHCHSHKAAYE